MVARLRGYSDASSLERFLLPGSSSSAPVMGSMSLSGGGDMIAENGQNFRERSEDSLKSSSSASRLLDSFSTGEIVV